MTGIPARAAERAYANYVESDGGCRVSVYSVASHGYSQIGWWADGRSHGTTAHRAAWTHVHGPIPEGMTVDHLCKNRRCVNVDHLRLLSNFENARRTSGSDWPEGQCKNGHSNDEIVLWGRKRVCRLCRNESQRQNRLKKRLL